MEPWWPGEQERAMAEVARPNGLATSNLDGELRVGVSDERCRISTDCGREKAVKRPAELPGGGSGR